MKTLKSLILSAVVLFSGMSALVAPASAANLDEAWMDELNKITSGGTTESDDSKCMNLAYVGASTEAVVTITGIAITAYAPGATLDTGDFGTALSEYDISAAAYDTAGELCTAIDGLTDYKCALVGCKSDDNSNLLRNQTQASGTNDLKANGGFDVELDSGAVAGSSQAGLIYVLRVGITPNVDRRVRLKQVITNNNGTGTMKVYGKLRKYENASDGVTRGDQTLVWNEVTADDTALTSNFTVSGNGGMDFAKNAHVVVSGGNATTAQLAANYMLVLWEER